MRIPPPGVVGGANTLSLSSTEFQVLRPHFRDTRMCVRRQTTKCLRLIAFLTSPSTSVNQKTRYYAWFPPLRTSRDTQNTSPGGISAFSAGDALPGMSPYRIDANHPSTLLVTFAKPGTRTKWNRLGCVPWLRALDACMVAWVIPVGWCTTSVPTRRLRINDL